MSESEPSVSIRRYQVAFFGTILGGLILIQTPAVVWILKVVATAEQSNVWTSTLRSNTPGILLALLVGLYIDLTRSKISRREQDELSSSIQRQFDQFQEVIGREPLGRVSREELLKEGFVRYLGQGAVKIDDLVTGILGKRGVNEPVYSYHAEYTLRDASDPNYFEVDCRFTMKWAIRSHTFAVVGGGERARDYMYKSVQDVNDVVYVPGLGDSFSETVQMLRDTYQISYLPPGKAMRRMILRPYEMTADSRDELLGPHFPEDPSRVVIFRVDIPETHEPLICSHTMRAAMNVPGLYTTFNDPTYVTEIKFDLQNLRAGSDFKFVGITTFLPCASDVLAEMGGRTQRVMVDNWILPGHGVMLTWN